MENQILHKSLIDINIELNDDKVRVILDSLLTFKNYTSKSQVASMILYTLIKNIKNIMKLNNNRYLLWAYIYMGMKRIEDNSPSDFEKGICSMLLNQISELLEVNDVFHLSVQSFYDLISEEENELEFNFLLAVLENIEANNIYVQHVDILIEDFNLIDKHTERDGKEKVEKKTHKKDYVKVLKPLLNSMFVHYADFDESKITYTKHLTNRLLETRKMLEELSKKGSSGGNKPTERGLK